MTSKLLNAWLTLAVCLVFTPAIFAQFPLVEGFDYADGDLTTVSGGLWADHSGSAPDIQVVSGEAVVTAPGSQDDNRQLGLTMGDTETWYYAVRFRVDPFEENPVNNDYFIHFRPEGFDFRARLATVVGAQGGDYTMQIWAASFGDGMTDWDGDFSFGDELIAVVRWENETATATLWINPVDENSTNISHQSLQDDDMDGILDDAMVPITSIALRQDSTTGSVVTIPVLAVSDNFSEVLAAVTPSGGDCPSGFERGDVNMDGSINLLDVAPFVDAISTGSTQCEADVNGDGAVDLLDVGPFVDLLGGG